jgi:hypothetical protein
MFDPLKELDSKDEAAPQKETRKRSSRRKQFDSATAGLNTSQIRSVTTPDSVKAGQYDRKTITLPPKQIRLIAQLRRKEGVGILAFYRWLIDQGLQAYERGERPQPADKVVHEVDLGHWSSKPDLEEGPE